MASLKQFAANMESYAANVSRNTTKLKRTAAIACLQAVILGTPVGNPTLWQHPAHPAGYVGGRARANWYVGLGFASKNISTAVDPSGQNTLASGRSEIGRTVPEQPIHLTNNLDYIVSLNDGHSTQAPRGFVQQAIAAADEAVKGMKVLE